MVAMGLQLIMKAPITALWALGKILDKGWQWSLATGVAVLILICVIIMLTMIFIIMPRASVSAKRILEVLENGGFYADLYNSQFEKVS